MICRDEREDCIQEAYVQLFARLGVDPPRPLLRHVARRRAVDAWRRAARYRAGDPSLHPSLPEKLVDWREPSVLAEQRELLERVRTAVAYLRPKPRQAIEAVFLQGRSRRDVAREEGVPLEAVNSRIREGLRQLRRRTDLRELLFDLAG